MANIVLIAHDHVRMRMAAPGIRCAEMSRDLARHGHQVTLAIPNDPEIVIDGVRQIGDQGSDLLDCIAKSDILITGGGPYEAPVVSVPPGVAHVIDMSFPLILEGLATYDRFPDQWQLENAPFAVELMARQLMSADFILCASTDQWQYYVGCMTILGRIRGDIIRADPSLRRLIAVVPFGCPDEPPLRTGRGPRELVAGLSTNDYLLLWSGYLSDWYDPEMVVRAVAAASDAVPHVRLVFMGARPGDTRLHETSSGARLRELTKQLQLDDKTVFFYDDWVPYDQRVNWLLDSDVGIVASPQTLESELAARARFLDYIWTATPAITTRGGTFAREFELRRLGLVVEPGDVDAMSKAIVALADEQLRSEMRTRLEHIRSDHTWQRTLAPLVEYCSAPHLAADRVDLKHSTGGPARSFPRRVVAALRRRLT
jgi:glycosyltransferase involved in cell wall biosynthesis